MKKQGTIVKWDHARGFGFIHSAASSTNVFFHVQDYLGRGRGTPQVGLAVTFDEVQVSGRGPRARAVQPSWEQVSPATASRAPDRGAVRRASLRAASPPSSGAFLVLPLMAAHASVLLWAAWTRLLPWWVLAALAVLNLVTFFVYAHDKYAASKGQWRTSEAALHLWGLAGGWPGAWFAQQMLRHKSSKRAFRAVYWATVFMHWVALLALLRWLPGWLAGR